MKYTIDREACLGCGICKMIYPELFQQDEENKALLKQMDPIDQSKVKEAQSMCPVDAILEY